MNCANVIDGWELPSMTKCPPPLNCAERKANMPRIRLVRWWLKQVAHIHVLLCCAIEEYVLPWNPVSQEFVDKVRKLDVFGWFYKKNVMYIPFEFGPLEEWDTSHVTNMSRLFTYSGVNVDLSRWDTSHVTDMSRMFYGCRQFNGNISTWNVSNVTDMSSMFHGSVSFNRDISGWNTSNVRDMQSMFWLAITFNQPIGDWDVSRVTNMESMFAYARKFNQPLDAWNISQKNTRLVNLHHSAADRCRLLFHATN